MKIYKNIFFALAALMGIVGLTSCDNHEEDVSLLELYTSGFVKQYGIPDPEQDWNMAEESELTIHLSDPASRVNVYVYAGTNYYRVGEFFNMPAGDFSCTVDIPEKSQIMVVTVDGYAFWAQPGSYVDASITRSKSSRADGDEGDGNKSSTELADDDTTTTIGDLMKSYEIFGMEEDKINPLGWIVLVEDLGSKDDFDFNDVVFRIECVTTNVTVITKDWNVVDQATNQVIKAPSRSASRDGGEGVQTGDDTNTRKLTIQALAAGGTLPIFLHFHTAYTDDYILTPWASSKLSGNSNGYVLTSNIKDTDTYDGDWHSWFYLKSESSDGSAQDDWKDTDNSIGSKTLYQMLNTKAERLSTKDDNGTVTHLAGASGLTGHEVSILLTYDWFGDSFSMTNYSEIKVSDDMKPLAANGFYITINTIDGTVSKAINPDAHTSTIATVWATKELDLTSPQMLLIPDINISSDKTKEKFRWPMERVRIDKVYPTFSGWVKDIANNATWYQSPVEGWYCRTGGIYNGSEYNYSWDTTWKDTTD